MTKLANVLSLVGLVVAIGCALSALGAGLGYRFGWWHYRAGIATLANLFWVAVGTAAVCAVALVLAATRANARRALVMGLAGLAIAGITAWVPYDLRMTASALPSIHDITTDLADPPKFVRVAALRKPDDHPAAYDGALWGFYRPKPWRIKALNWSPELNIEVILVKREAVE